jgi:hypothetical protein
MARAVPEAANAEPDPIRQVGLWDPDPAAAEAAIATIPQHGANYSLVEFDRSEQFPAVVLWNFRVASIGAQFIMWATLGLLFGALSQRTAKYQR